MYFPPVVMPKNIIIKYISINYKLFERIYIKMNKNDKMKDYNYRIVKCSNWFCVEKKKYTFFRNKPYWERERTTVFNFEGTDGQEYDLRFKSIESAEKYINDDKIKNDTTEKISKYI